MLTAPLVISATPTFYNPIIGTSVILNCVVTSGTATSITWLRSNVILNINADSRLAHGNVSIQSLSISNVQQSDSGRYVCRAADVTGTVVNSKTIASSDNHFSIFKLLVLISRTNLVDITSLVPIYQANLF